MVVFRSDHCHRFRGVAICELILLTQWSLWEKRDRCVSPQIRINALPLMHGESECVSLFKAHQGLFVCDVSSNETCLSFTLIMLFICKPPSLWVKSGHFALAGDYCNFGNSSTPIFSTQMAWPQRLWYQIEPDFFYHWLGSSAFDITNSTSNQLLCIALRITLV